MKTPFLLAMLACGIVFRPLPASAEPTVSVGSTTVAPGGIATLPVTLNADVLNANGVELHLSHSSVVPSGGAALSFAALDVKELPASLSGAAFDSNDDASGYHVALVNADPFNGPLDVVSLKVQAPATAIPGAIYSLSLSAKVTDSDGNAIPVKTEGGSITIIGTSPPPIKGDLNGDGKVTVADATLALQFAVGLANPTPLQLIAADLNGDGAIKVTDVTRILQAAVGQIKL